jgi:serine/threonine protein phosphatase 1
MRTYAIGDIHGHLDLLMEVHAWIKADIAKHGPAPVVHIGDLVDRGPDSRGVIDFLRDGIAAGEDWIVLKGNHDRMFSYYLQTPPLHDPRLRPDLSWLNSRLGGGTTLASYGVKSPTDRPLDPVHKDALAAVPAEHRLFLESLPTFHARGEVFFCHAGIRPGVALSAQVEDDLVWIRHEFLDDSRDHGKLIVHGHTAIDAPTHYGNRLNIDSSAAYGGPLSVVALEGRRVFHLIDGTRHELLPV